VKKIFYIILTFMMLTSIFLPHAAFAIDDPHPGWDVNSISIPGLPADVAITAMALDSAGDAHVLISKNSSPIGSYYSKLSGGVWGVPEVVDNTAYHGWNSEIVLDSNDNPRVIYYMDGGSHYGLNYAERIGGVWIRTGLDSRFWTGKSNDLKLDSLGNPHLVYTAIDGNLVYGKRIGGSWSFENVENMGFTDTGNHVGLALDQMDKPGIVYTSRNTGYLRYARNTGSGWTFSNIDYILNSTHGIMWVETNPSIVFDQSGALQISYISKNTVSVPNGYALKYARWNGVNWILQTLNEQVWESGLCNSAIRIDSLNTLHVAWWGYPVIVHATSSPPFGVWNSEFVSTIPTWSGAVTLQLDYQNVPHITYMPSMGGRYATKHVNDAPVANNQTVMTDEDTALAITLTATDIDSSSLTYSIVSQPGHGTLNGIAPNVTYVPNLNYNGLDSFTFKANDGQADSNIATVSITVRPVNDPPVIQSLTVNPNQLWPPNKKPVDVKVTVVANDPDGVNDISRITYSVTDEYGIYSVAETNLPANGTISLIADRDGKDQDGRIYTIVIRVYDTGGLFDQRNVNVIVPHDQGK
jgi:hypothetical protein